MSMTRIRDVFFYHTKGFTNFPDMWTYFKNDAEHTSGDVENHFILYGIQINTLRKDWKLDQKNQSFNHFEVWRKGGDAPEMDQFTYLAAHSSLLFLPQFSTPIRDTGPEDPTMEDLDKLDDTKQLKAYVSRLAAKLDNNKRIDLNTLEWIVPSWQAIMQNQDLELKKTVQNLYVAAKYLTGSYKDTHINKIRQLRKKTMSLADKVRNEKN